MAGHMRYSKIEVNFIVPATGGCVLVVHMLPGMSAGNTLPLMEYQFEHGLDHAISPEWGYHFVLFMQHSIPKQYHCPESLQKV